jgi:Cu2+-exporting ATPase
MDALARCAHCSQPLPPDAPTAMVGGVSCAVCCRGCAAAARWIAEAGLDDYYRLRNASAPRPDDAAPDFAAWTHPEILQQHVVRVDGGLALSVLTDRMHCAACAWLIDNALRRLPGVLDAGANAVTGRVRFAWNPDLVALPAILARLHALGFPPRLARSAASEAARSSERRRDLIRLGVAGLGAMQAMMLAEAVYLDTAGQMDVATRDFFRWMTFFVSTPVVFFSGWPFISGMMRDIARRHLGMDALVGSSILLAYGASLAETLRGGPQVWFDAAVMFVLLLLAARQLERWARARAGAQVELLAQAKPVLATREVDARHEQVPVSMLAAGDVVCVASGEALPADGVLLDDGELDEALLTGEASMLRRAAGEAVLAGSVAGSVALRLRVTATGGATYLSFLQRLMERAGLERPPIARLADRIAGVFVPVLFLLAAATFAAWWQIDASRAFAVALSVLVVSCPCALSLAIPTALTTAYGALARRGVLPLRGDALEALAGVDTVLFDKTGTLTAGKGRIVAAEAFHPTTMAQASAFAHALQGGGTHPLAQAFALPDDARRETLTQSRSHPGLGIEGIVDGRRLRLGRADFAAAGRDDGAIWLGDGVTALARFEIGDQIRADARDAVAQLTRLGLAVELSSGDAQPAVDAVAAAVGIRTARARQSPEAKLERLRTLQREGHRAAMIGDGINDAPVLAGADVSFAFGSGAATAHRHADFVLTGDTLARIPQAIVLARQTRRIVRQSLAWAVGYNLVALPFAALGSVEPWVAALGMTLSSLAVTLNALRLRSAMDRTP